MKKPILVFFLFIIAHLQLQCQIKTISVDCTDSYLMSIKGEYKQSSNKILPGTQGSARLTPAQQQAVLKRMDTLHQMLLSAYPVPTGFEALWWKSLNPGDFAADINLKNGIPVYTYRYKVNFNSYSCHANKPRDLFCCEPGTSTFEVIVNDFGYFGYSAGWREKLTINGLPVFMRNPVKGNWKGYDLVYEGDFESTKRIVLLHRPGELPYITVSRKQYLEFCLKYLGDFWDEQMKGANAMPAGSSDEKKQREVTIQKISDTKKRVLKRYEDEMEKTKTANMLDLPAIILEVASINEDVPIFTTEEENGKMLYTHNPAYIKTNLPKNVAQFLVVRWTWSDNQSVGGSAGINYRQMLEEKFPIEQLQAMIDK